MSLQTEAHLREVEQLVGRLEAAFNARDPAALAALYTQDAVLMPPNERQVQGSRAIQLWFTQALPRLGTTRLYPAATRTDGSLAVQVGGFQMISRSTDSGATVPERAGKYVLVLTRAGERWAICADLWNLDQPLG
jgi:uncharacterized protein (TIGR02246 family)